MSEPIAFKNIHQLRLFYVALGGLMMCMFGLPISESITDIGYLIAIVFGLLAISPGQYWRVIIQNPVTYWMLGILAVMLLGTLYTSASKDVLLHYAHKSYWVLGTPLLIPLLQSKHARRMVIDALLIANALIIVLWLLRLCGLELSFFRSGSIFRDYIVQGLFMGFSTSVWLYRLLNWQQHKIAYAVLYALGTLVIFASVGRTGYGVWVLGTMLVFAMSSLRYRWIFAIVVCSITLGLAVLFSPSFSHRLDRAVQGYDQSQQHYMPPSSGVGIRMAMLKGGWLVAQNSLWFGHGTASYPVEFSKLPHEVLYAANYRHGAMPGLGSEITYITVLVNYGLLGLAGLAALFAYFWLSASRLEPQITCISRVFLVSFFFGAVATAFFLTSFASHFFSVMMALCYANLRFKHKDDAVEYNSLPTVVPTD